MAATKNHVMRIATAPVGTAPGAMPAAGVQVGFGTTPWAAFTVWPIMLNDDDIVIPKTLEKFIIQGPTELAPEEVVILKNFIGEITLSNYEMTVETFSLMTSATDTTGTVVEAGTHVKLAVAIEITGIGLIYMANCTIEWPQLTGSTVKTGKMDLMITPFSHTALASGTNFDWMTSDGDA